MSSNNLNVTSPIGLLSAPLALKVLLTFSIPTVSLSAYSGQSCYCDASCAQLGRCCAPMCATPEETTLSKTIVPSGHGASGLIKRYRKLANSDKGWPMVIRDDLIHVNPHRAASRQVIASFIQITDVHLTDQQSPVRIQYARSLTEALERAGKNAYKPQNMLTTWVGESMVQRINKIDRGPILGADVSFVISTGDNADMHQFNELNNFVNLYDGGFVQNDSSKQNRYVGVSDNWTPKHDPVLAANYYYWYWHPGAPPFGHQPDLWKTYYGYPEYPGLLDAAVKDFTSTGLSKPWYQAYGNHDAQFSGIWASAEGTLLSPAIAQRAVGSFMKIAPPTTLFENNNHFLWVPFEPLLALGEELTCLSATTRECLSWMFGDFHTQRKVPVNSDRKPFSAKDFVLRHFATPSYPGPVGHGFTNENIVNDTLYYRFNIAPEIIGITMDTVNHYGLGPDGSIGAKQMAWIEQQLQSVSSSYYNKSGNLVRTGNRDKLVVLFSHHNHETLVSLDGSRSKDPNRLMVNEVMATFHRYPNIVLWVNGHTHYNRVWSHKDPATRTSGFWEINTASHIDYPQQSRAIEIADNKDGTLSIFGTIIDHLAPGATVSRPITALELASVSRELALNDPGIDTQLYLGKLSDRNVELVISNPLSGSTSSTGSMDTELNAESR